MGQTKGQEVNWNFVIIFTLTICVAHYAYMVLKHFGDELAALRADVREIKEMLEKDRP